MHQGNRLKAIIQSRMRLEDFATKLKFKHRPALYFHLNKKQLSLDMILRSCEALKISPVDFVNPKVPVERVRYSGPVDPLEEILRLERKLKRCCK